MHQQLSLVVIAGRCANPLKLYLQLTSLRRPPGRCRALRCPELQRMQVALKNKTLKLRLRRLIILITVFDIQLFKARRGWGMKGDTCNFVSVLISFNKIFLHLIFPPVFVHF